MRRRIAVISSFGALLVLLLLALFPGVVTRHDPLEQDLVARLKGPSVKHPLGTDKFGRDVLSRTMHGARVSVAIGVGAVVIAGAVGVTMGLLAGYYGGAVEVILMRLTDAQSAFPSIILAIIAVAAFGSSLPVLVGVLGVIGWVEYARIVYNNTRSLREREYVVGARSVGAGDLRIIVRYILANTWTPVIVVAAFQVAQMILAEAGLSFLGLGVQPPTPSWGSMLNEGKDVMTIAPWLLISPGLAITVTVCTINLSAEAIRGMVSR